MGMQTNLVLSFGQDKYNQQKSSHHHLQYSQFTGKTCTCARMEAGTFLV